MAGRPLFIPKFLLGAGRGKTETSLGHIGSLYCPLYKKISGRKRCVRFLSPARAGTFLSLQVDGGGVANNAKSTVPVKGWSGGGLIGKDPSDS